MRQARSFPATRRDCDDSGDTECPFCSSGRRARPATPRVTDDQRAEHHPSSFRQTAGAFSEVSQAIEVVLQMFSKLTLPVGGGRHPMRVKENQSAAVHTPGAPGAPGAPAPSGRDHGVTGRSCRTPSTVMSTLSLKKLTSPWI